MIIDLNKQHPLFTDVNIKVYQSRLIVDNDTKTVILNCKTLYYKDDIDITEQFMAKYVDLIADNTTTQTTLQGEVGMFDFLTHYMSQPKAINDLIGYYITKNIDKF